MAAKVSFERGAEIHRIRSRRNAQQWRLPVTQEQDANRAAFEAPSLASLAGAVATTRYANDPTCYSVRLTAGAAGGNESTAATQSWLSSPRTPKFCLLARS
jgi:hypothetical protein